MSMLLMLATLLLCLGNGMNGVLADELTVLASPKEVKVADVKHTSLADIFALPYNLFGLDERQSALLADVSFLRRPRLLALLTVACGAKCPIIGLANNKHKISIDSDAGELLLGDSVAGVQAALHRSGMLHSVLLDSDSLTESTNPELFQSIANSDKLPPVADEASVAGYGQQELIAEMRTVQEAARRLIESKLLADSQPDVLHLQINSLANQRSVPESVQKFVAKFINQLADELVAATGQRAFVAMATVSQDAPLLRIGRSLLAATEAPPASNSMNLAADYSPDFPIMFNLILWLCVVLALAVYAVGYSLWNIDPGKDGIVYRRGYAHAKVD